MRKEKSESSKKMPDGDNGESSSSDRDHSIEALRKTQEEARTVLDHQIQTFNDVDDKAARTSRLDALLIGLIFTAGSFLAQADQFDVAVYFNGYAAGGIISLILSFILAIITYTTTNIQTGVGPSDINRLINKRYTEKEWLILLLRSEAEWMLENEKSQTINGTLLSGSHLMLIIGVILIVLSIGTVHWPF